MATNLFCRSLPKTLTLASFLSRSFSSALARPRSASLSLLHRLRPLSGAGFVSERVSPAPTIRCLSSNATSSSLKDPNPNWSNRPPKETILLDGCDFEHWLVVMEPPEGDPTRDEIIDSYIKTLAACVGSEQEARMKIYSVSTRCYYAFGALVSEEMSYKIKELPKVRWVLPDSYLDVKNKDYGGEPFINGEAVPYDPKYHEEWIRNNARANERNRRNDRPRNFDRSRNFERRRENMQPQQNQGPPPPGGNFGPPPPRNNMGPPPSNLGGMQYQNNRGPPPPNNMNQPNYPQSNLGPPPPNPGGYPPNNMNQPPNYNAMPPPQNNNWNGPPNNYRGGPPPPPPPHQGGNNMGQMPPPSNMGGGPPNNAGGMQQNSSGWSGPSNYTPNRDM